MKQRIVTYLFIGGVSVLAASPALMKFLERWEGVEYVVYADKLAGGLPTVCSGITKHVSPYPVVVGERWSPEKCREVEGYVTLEIQRKLQQCVTSEVPQSVFDALTSHAWNTGWNNTCNSASVKALNSGHFKKGCDLLAYKSDGSPNWSHAGGKFIQGLHNRRKDERELCLRDLQ